MPLSSNLLSYLKKGRFPLLATEGFRLWEELVSALEKYLLTPPLDKASDLT